MIEDLIGSFANNMNSNMQNSYWEQFDITYYAFRWINAGDFKVELRLLLKSLSNAAKTRREFWVKMKSYSVPQSETDRNLKESDRDLFGKSFLKASAERKRGRDYYELKNDLERSLHKNMEEMEDRRRFKWCSLVLVYHPAIILA